MSAAAWDATVLHDQYFVENEEGSEEKPNQFAKWAVELGLKPEVGLVDTISPGKFHYFITKSLL